MPEFKFHRRSLQYLEKDHLQQQRKITEPYSMGYNNESVQNLNKKHSLLVVSPTTEKLKDKSNSNSYRQTVVKASDVKKDLGHDLYQLTQGNQHEVNLSPYPSLTIMVQPNKIDYTERSMHRVTQIKISLF